MTLRYMTNPDRIPCRRPVYWIDNEYERPCYLVLANNCLLDIFTPDDMAFDIRSKPAQGCIGLGVSF